MIPMDVNNSRDSQNETVVYSLRQIEFCLQGGALVDSLEIFDDSLEIGDLFLGIRRSNRVPDVLHANWIGRSSHRHVAAQIDAYSGKTLHLFKKQKQKQTFCS